MVSPVSKKSRMSRENSVFGDSFISSLVKQKEKDEAIVNRSNTIKIRDDLMKSTAKMGKTETKKERLRRHMLLLKHLVTSDHELMKRKLLDLVDDVHSEEK